MTNKSGQFRLGSKGSSFSDTTEAGSERLSLPDVATTPQSRTFGRMWSDFRRRMSKNTAMDADTSGEGKRKDKRNAKPSKESNTSQAFQESNNTPFGHEMSVLSCAHSRESSKCSTGLTVPQEFQSREYSPTGTPLNAPSPESTYILTSPQSEKSSVLTTQCIYPAQPEKPRIPSRPNTTPLPVPPSTPKLRCPNGDNSPISESGSKEKRLQDKSFNSEPARPDQSNLLIQEVMDPNLKKLVSAAERDAYQLLAGFESSIVSPFRAYNQLKKTFHQRQIRCVILLVDLANSELVEDVQKILMALSNDPAKPLPLVVNYAPGKSISDQDGLSTCSKLDLIEKLIKGGAGDVILKCDQDIPLAIETAVMRTRVLWDEAETIIKQEALAQLQVWAAEASYSGVVLPEIDSSLRPQPTAQGTILLSNLELIKKLGAGSYAKVYEARCTISTNQHQTWAVKYIKKILDDRAAKGAMREIKALRKISTHPNVPVLHKVLHSPDALYLCIDFGGSENLHKLQCRSPQKKFSLSDVQDITSQLSSAILHIHRHQVCHRDVKPENVTMNGKKAVLVDYGLSDCTDKILDLCCGSMPFAAPEVMEDTCRYYGAPVDAFALGVSVFEMVWGLDSFCNMLGWKNGSHEASSKLADKVRAALANGVQHPKQWPPEMQDVIELIDGLIKPWPEKRWSFDQVAQSVFLAPFAHEHGLPNASILGA